MLSKAEMKTVIGGSGECIQDSDCPGSMCCSNYGYCGTTEEYCRAGGSGPKIDACKSYREGDPCGWNYNGHEYSGRCTYRAPSYILYCSSAL